MTSLAKRTVFLSGGSRGIGLEIAKRLARDGANVALIAKTAEPDPRLPGTIYTAAEEIEKAGGTALPIVGDIRAEARVADLSAYAYREGADLMLDLFVNPAGPSASGGG